MFPRALSLMEAGHVDLQPLITDRYRFDESIQAFEYAANMRPSSMKVQIELVS